MAALPPPPPASWEKELLLSEYLEVLEECELCSSLRLLYDR